MNEDLSSLFDKINIDKNSISPEMINNLMASLGISSQNNSETNQEEYSNQSNSTERQDSSNFDFDTILKMKSIIDKMNEKDDPRSNLLQSLKPYLNENRRSKVDQYVQLMNLSRVMEAFSFMGGDNKNVTK